MTIRPPRLTELSEKIKAATRAHRYSEALQQLDAMAQASSAPWEIRSAIQSLKESYGYLRRYALDGIEDPQRNVMLAEICSQIITQTTRVERLSLIEDNTSLYYGVLRYERMQPDSEIASIIEKYRTLDRELGMAMLGRSQGGVHATRFRKLLDEHTATGKRLFNKIWTAYPLRTDDVNAIESFLTDSDVRVELREHILGAVMLGAMQQHDDRRAVILAKIYLSNESKLELRALVALIVTLWMNRMEPVSRELRDVMAAVSELPRWHDDLKMTFLSLVRTRDTDRISRTMNEEVIPKMMKLRPEIFKKFSERESAEEYDPGEINPEWEEMLEKSGVTDRLKELNELQAEGGDVMMSTFAGLKSFPFFHEVSNWFVPFYTDRAELLPIFDDSAEDLAEMIDLAPMICDNDKYSIAFSLETMPSANRRMMLEQFRAQNINIAEFRNSMLNPEVTSRAKRVNYIVHDLYRFFTLFRRKSEFTGPFVTPVNLAAVPLLSGDLIDNTAMEAVAEFYFKRKYYAEAYELFRFLLDRQADNATLFQKAGYCAQRLGSLDEAVELYLKSELLLPDSLWTIRRLAQCLKQLGRHSEAIPYYERLTESRPEDLNAALNLGHCYLAVGDYKSALKCYFKVEYLDESGDRALRPIAWCAFVEADYERAARYYDKILSRTPYAGDYLNAGHLAMATKRYRDAQALYKKYMDNAGAGDKTLAESVAADRDYLIKAGVDDVMLSLVIDAASAPEL